jgi:SAM-dependent methyltransferase
VSTSVERQGHRAALRGNPSFVWRAGQDRRLDMVLKWGKSPGQEQLDRVLVNGCGVGMYVKALQPFARQVYGLDIEPVHLSQAVENVPEAPLHLAACESLPYPDDFFDLILSHEVLEHVVDDWEAVVEMVRTLKPGGRAVIFVPNRLYPFETHGHYWQGQYHFGNTPLINYLPDSVRARLAPHVRAYTMGDLRQLFIGLPVRVLHHAQIFPGYDNIVQRSPLLGRCLRWISYALERTPLARFGLSHLLVVERTF